jgi:type II secretory pathway pseudopilin PulG
MIVLIIIGMLTGFVMFNFPQQIVRWRMTSSANHIASILQRTRLEAVRRNQPGTVEIIDGEMVAMIGTLEFRSVLKSGVTFSAPAGEDIVDGFGDTDIANFRVDGTVDEAGAFRLGGDRGYFFEIRIDPPATARTEVRKWDPATSKFVAQGDGGKSWEW